MSRRPLTWVTALLTPRDGKVVDRGQMLGGIFGLASLTSLFLLPFSNVAEGPSGPADTLYAIFNLFISTLSNIQAIGLTAISNLAYVYIVATIVIIVSGIIGVRPITSAFFGFIGISLATFSPFFIFTNYTFGSTTYGAGFWALWAFPILLLVVGLWARRGSVPKPTVQKPAPPPVSA